jgi:ferritin-like protein
MLDTMEKECTKEEQPNADEKHSAAYYKELQEIREELPEEIKDFADVFCSED